MEKEKLIAVNPAKAAAATNVFEPGRLSVNVFKVEKSNASSSPPKTLLIVTPTAAGSYPVLLFLPGFCICNYSYSLLLRHIASHGFIVVAPQLYICPLTSGTEEVQSAGTVTNWLSAGLQSNLPENVTANLQKLALSGHSRGGKAAFALALGYAEPTLKFSALLGLDPVAGVFSETDPKILTYQAHSFNLSMPVAVIGTGLGDEQKCCLVPACAPNGLNHEEFFRECKAPCSYFVAKDYGHMDMLNDPAAKLGSCVCASGKGAKDLFRMCLGGLFVAFLRAYLEDDNADFKAILEDPSIAPVTLDPMIYMSEDN
ncbi:chlorophyllase-1 [Diospyros lotus]|uniref:chlorophyllase-1 n=1 Tax=Diospyros lotus TaxID=55363 RepID=UPI0022567690|nr:chlorophyllase-1 [Diospyros lotus]